MIGSMMRQSAAVLIADGAHVGEVGLLRVAQVATSAAGGLDRGRPAFETEAFEAVRLAIGRAARAGRASGSKLQPRSW